jgi:hypothetical protein
VESRVGERDALPETETVGVTNALVLGVSKSAVPLRVELERLGEVTPEERTRRLETAVSPTKESDGEGEC